MPVTVNAQEYPVQIVGSSKFGKYPFVNDERTWNMFVSDETLINFAGYEEAVELLVGESGEGRGIFHSTRGRFSLVIINDKVFRVNEGLGFSELNFTLSTLSGEVIMDENLSSQICIVDRINAYIYNYRTGDIGIAVFDPPNPDFLPNYVTYQNTYFIFGNARTDTGGSRWFIYESGFNPSTLADPLKLSYVTDLALQTKPDFAKAAIRIPSYGNNLLVLGSTVGEIWTNVGGRQVYQRNSTINIDYGVASTNTIAASDKFVCWLGINEKSTPAIMIMSGGQAERISTDGIDNLLETVNFPEQSTAFFFRQDGHVFYVLSFIHADDNFSIMYDINTQSFYDITDFDFTYHPARQVAYFNNNAYFVSIKQPSLMRLGSDLATMSTDDTNVYQIPTIRRTNTIRFPGSKKFIANLFSFTIENGVEEGVNFKHQCEGHILGESSGLIMYSEDDRPLLVEGGFCMIYRPRIDLYISKNGGQTYSNFVSYYMHKTAHYWNQPRFPRLGQANQLTFQLRFHYFGRKAIKDAVVEIRD